MRRISKMTIKNIIPEINKEELIEAVMMELKEKKSKY